MPSYPLLLVEEIMEYDAGIITETLDLYAMNHQQEEIIMSILIHLTGRK